MKREGACSVMNTCRHVGGEVHMLSNLIRRKLDETMPPEVTGAHGKIIGFLFRNRERDVFQRDVEAEFHLRRSTASGILQLMEKNGLLYREAVPYDARLKKLVLTPKALALHQDILQHINALEARITRGVSPAELEQFFVTIETFRRNLEA